MSVLVFQIGSVIAATLVALLVATLLRPSLRIWPTPGPGTWQSYVFWPLFRSLNVLAFAAAWFDRTPLLGLSAPLRSAAAAVCLAAIGVFVWAFRVLGRDNSYGATDGLVTAGIYQWSRNPQNGMLMLVYGSLAIAADSLAATTLCAGMILVYWLMILLEEPWLRQAYGAAYENYCREVPRLFNWRRLVRWNRGRT